MKSIALALMLSAPQLLAQDASVISTIDSYMESQNPLEELTRAFATDPDFAGKVLNICVNSECLILDLTTIMEKGGQPETVAGSEWSRDITAVVKAATGGVSGSATVKVKVTRTETNKDGSSKETKVDVEVKVEGKK